MPFDDVAKLPARPVRWIVELVLDHCSNTYGQAPCTATGGPGMECYNTRNGCQDEPNWNPGETTRSVMFTNMGGQQVITNSSGIDVPLIPAIDGAPAFTSPKVEPGSLGARGSVSITLMDFISPDHIYSDPYLGNRLVAASGTWLGRFRARHKYYKFRQMFVYEGYESLPFGDWRKRSYLIDEISGPSAGPNGRMTIVGRDPLKALDGETALVPGHEVVTLAVGVNPAATTFVLSSAVSWAPGSYAVIGEEIVLMVSTSDGGTTWTVTRGQFGSSSTSHDAGDNIQLVYYADGLPIEQVIRDLLQDYAGIDSSFIPYAEWQTEISTFMPGRTVTGVIRKPLGVERVLNQELLPENNLMMFWDDLSNLIRLRAGSPFQSVTQTFDHEQHLVSGSTVVRDAPRRQVTRGAVWYGLTPLVADRRPENCTRLEVNIDPVAESAALYGAKQQREFTSRWFLGSQQADVALTLQHLVGQFTDMPQEMVFEIDAKDVTRFKLGDVIDVLTPSVVGLSGERETFRALVTQVTPSVPGHRYRVNLLRYFSPSAGTVPTEVIISSNVQNYDLYTALGGPPQPIVTTVRVQTGVTISSGNAALPAFTTGNLDPGSTVILVREGTALIVGIGGQGGAWGSPQQPGGNAVEFTCNGSIDNQGVGGYIAGGGGGGGSGGDNTLPFNPLVISGGGGGGGINNGAGGTAIGTGSNVGSAGTNTTGGTGGAVPIGSAGAGGDLGLKGLDGSLRIAAAPDPEVFIDVVGGAAGNSVVLNGNTVPITGPGGNLIGPVSP